MQDLRSAYDLDTDGSERDVEQVVIKEGSPMSWDGPYGCFTPETLRVEEDPKRKKTKKKSGHTWEGRMNAELKACLIHWQTQAKFAIRESNRFFEVDRCKKVERVYQPEYAPDSFPFDRALYELR